MTKPHPSCYTCNHFEDKQWGMCCNLNSDDYGLSQFMVGFIERVGCASHSDSDKVLDEVIMWCNMFDDYTCSSTFTPSFVLKKIVELRNQHNKKKR